MSSVCSVFSDADYGYILYSGLMAFRAFCKNNDVILVGEDKPCKDGEAGNALALSMQPDAAGCRRSQKMATEFLQDALEYLETPQ